LAEHGYRVIYEPLAEGGFQVIIPAFPGIVTYGRTIEDAKLAKQNLLPKIERSVRPAEKKAA
jgi:predicted RNase H-like HicB family nuclease